MELALRRRLEGVVDVRISQARQTAAVVFSPGAPAFAASEFRGAVGEADVEVVRFEVDACGLVERAGASTWFHAGGSRFLLTALPSMVTGEYCLTAVLDDGGSLARLEHIRQLPDQQP